MKYIETIDLLRDNEFIIPEKVKKTISFFEKGAAWYIVTRNQDAHACRDAASKRNRNNQIGIPLSDELKTYFGEYKTENGKKQLLLINLPGDCRIDFNQVKLILGINQKIKLAGKVAIGLFQIQFGEVNPFLIYEKYQEIINRQEYEGLVVMFDRSLMLKKSSMMTNAGELSWGIEFNPSEVVSNFNNVISDQSFIELDKKIKKMSQEKKILLITTGGTIANKVAKRQDANAKKKDALYFQRVIEPLLKKIEIDSKVKLSIESDELCSIDSSNILPEHWKALGNKVHKEFDNFDAFLITHGTNTLGYTAAALSFMFENLGKPVILTGSQIPYGNPGSDALMNLENAIRVAVGTSSPLIKGVSLVFGSHIITGVRVKKTTGFDYDAFKSFTTSSIGRIGRIITINQANLEKHLSYLNKHSKPTTQAKDLKVFNNFDHRIASLSEFPGMSWEIFKSLVEEGGIRGIILRAFGAGDASDNLEEGFQYLKRKEIPIVVTSQAPNGVSSFLVNEPGQRLNDNHLAIPAWDMSIESQTVKLAWLLGQNFSYTEIMDKMLIDYRGEINVNLSN